MIKLKDLLEGKNYNSPGYENRQFGDPLPTLEDITKKYQEGKEDVNEKAFSSSIIAKAIKVAKSMGGNMTAAVKKIEKMEKGLSKNGRVEFALQKANEGLGDKFSKKLSKFNKKNQKSRDAMKKYAKLKKKESVDEALHPYKDFDGFPKEEYDLNLGAFVEHYQDFMKFMKKHKEVPDKNKREWALAIRNKVGRGMFNGHMSQMSNIMDLLEMGDKFRNLKEGVNEAAMELNKIKDAILMFQKKIKKQGRVTNARDEDHLKNLIKLYKKMGGKGVKESVNESISAFDVDFYKDTSNRQTSHKEIVRGDKFSDVISKTTKVAKSKKMNYVELYYKGAFIGSIDKKNSFKFRKGRNHQKSPLSVNEGQKKRASDILRKFDMAYIKFSQEVRDVMKLMDKSTGSKVDGKIINKAYGKHLIPFDDLMQSWAKGQQENPGLDEAYDIWMEDGSFGGTFTGLVEAEYQGRKVKLGKPMQGDSKKFKVYVKNPKGNVVKVNFGQGGDAKGGTMRIRKSNPKARANFRARHNCDSPGPRHKARYWSCRKW